MISFQAALFGPDDDFVPGGALYDPTAKKRKPKNARLAK